MARPNISGRESPMFAIYCPKNFEKEWKTFLSLVQTDPTIKPGVHGKSKASAMIRKLILDYNKRRVKEILKDKKDVIDLEEVEEDLEEEDEDIVDLEEGEELDKTSEETTEEEEEDED